MRNSIHFIWSCIDCKQFISEEKRRVQENMNHKTVKVMYEALRLCGHKVLDEHLQFGFTN